MTQSYAIELLQLHKSFENKLESLDARIYNSVRKLNFIYNLLRRNDFSEKRSRHIVKMMDVKGARHAHRPFIYKRNDSHPMSGLNKNQVGKLLDELSAKMPDYCFNYGADNQPYDWDIVKADDMIKGSDNSATVKGTYDAQKPKGDFDYSKLSSPTFHILSNGQDNITGQYLSKDNQRNLLDNIEREIRSRINKHG